MNDFQRSELADWGTFLLRVAFGVILIAHGFYLKIFIFTVAGTAGFFESIGLPAFMAYLVIFGETAGGIALLLGIYPRLVAFLSLPIMIGATWAHADKGWVFSSAGGGWEFPAFLVVVAIVIALQGAGKFALKSIPVVDDFVPAVFKA